MTLDRKFEQFISSLWHGEKIDEMPNCTFLHGKADYLLHERGVIVEVKHLTEDRGRTIAEKLKQLADADPDFPQFFGNVHVEEIINNHRDSDNFRRWICNYAARTLDSLIRNADSQIEDTRKALALERSTGVLVLLNDGIQLYDDDFVYQEVSRILHKRSGDLFERPNVEAVWYVNEYKTEKTKRGSSSAFIGPAARNDHIGRMLNMLHVAWCTHNGYAMQRSAGVPR